MTNKYNRFTLRISLHSNIQPAHGFIEIHIQHLYRCISDIAGLLVPNAGPAGYLRAACPTGRFSGPQTQWPTSGDTRRARQLPYPG